MAGKKGQLKALVAVIVILLVIGLIPTILVAANMASSGESFKNFLANVTGIDKALITFPQYMWYLVLPYVATVAIIMGLFESIGIFRKGRVRRPDIYYLIIALGWAGVLIPTGALVWITGILFALGTIYGIIIFVAMFIIGASFMLLTSYRRGSVYASEAAALKTDIDTIKNQIDRLRQDYTRAQPKDRDKIAQRISNLTNRLANQRKKLQEEAAWGEA
jgi:hypothetical protein